MNYYEKECIIITDMSEEEIERQYRKTFVKLHLKCVNIKITKLENTAYKVEIKIAININFLKFLIRKHGEFKED